MTRPGYRGTAMNLFDRQIITKVHYRKEIQQNFQDFQKISQLYQHYYLSCLASSSIDPFIQISKRAVS